MTDLHTKKHLSFSSLRKSMSEHFHKLEDGRQNGKVDHSLHDCCMSAFAMMFFQDPSMLEFQRRLQHLQHSNNLKTIFNVESIPKSTQLKDVVDLVSSEKIEPLFHEFFKRLQRGKHLEQFQYLDGKYIVAIDGTQYFESESISCPCCLKKTLKNGNTLYYHQVIAATIVRPDARQVIPLAPEPIKNIDGSSKQDCERNAGKRLIKKIRATHPKLEIIITGDDLYANSPFIKDLKNQKMSYIFVAKPGDHKFMFECLADFEEFGDIRQLSFRDEKGKTHIYKWINGVPLNKTQEKENFVNYFEYTIMNNDKRNYHCSWVTDMDISENNVKKLVKAGRSKWKIENEASNTLKNQGYHMDHNFGHGEKNLSYNLLLLNFLAFYIHQILELTDKLYQACRATCSAKKEYWNTLRSVIKIIIFQSFEHMLSFIIAPPDDPPPP